MRNEVSCCYTNFCMLDKWAFRWRCLLGKIPPYTQEDFKTLLSKNTYYSWMNDLYLLKKEDEININHRFYSYIHPACLMKYHTLGPTDTLRRLWEVLYVEPLTEMPLLIHDKLIGFVALWRLEIGK